MTHQAGLGDVNYRQLAEEISGLLEAAATTADQMQQEARTGAAAIMAAAEAQLQAAYVEARQVVDDARMEADMLRAETEWQAQETLAQARRQAGERLAGADARLAELEKVEGLVLDRLAGVGQVLADSMARLREGTPAGADAARAGGSDDDEERPVGRVYFVEFPPAAAADPAPMEREEIPEPEIVLADEEPEIALSTANTTAAHSEWAPPADGGAYPVPAWWSGGEAQG